MTDNWRDDANCKGHPVDWWFPKRGERIDPRAIAICNECPVRRHCHQHAATFPEHFGVWAGVEASARKTARGVQQRARVTISEQIIELFTTTGRRHTSRDIADRLDAKYDTVGTALTRLQKRGLVVHDPEWHSWGLVREMAEVGA